MAAPLRPGRFYMLEGHPLTDILADDALTFARDYFRDDAVVLEEPGTYTDAKEGDLT